MILSFNEVFGGIFILIVLIGVLAYKAVSIGDASMWDTADRISHNAEAAEVIGDYATACAHNYAWFMFVNSRLPERIQYRNLTPARFFGNIV